MTPQTIAPPAGPFDPLVPDATIGIHDRAVLVTDARLAPAVRPGDTVLLVRPTARPPCGAPVCVRLATGREAMGWLRSGPDPVAAGLHAVEVAYGDAGAQRTTRAVITDLWLVVGVRSLDGAMYGPPPPANPRPFESPSCVGQSRRRGPGPVREAFAVVPRERRRRR